MNDIAALKTAEPEAGLIDPLIEALPPYQGPPNEQDLYDAGFQGRVRRMHLNECPLPPSPRVVGALRDAAIGINRYPDSKWRALTGLLAQRLGVPASRIVFGNGSDQLLQDICGIVLNPERTMVGPEPSFPRYIMAARLKGAQVIFAPLDADGASDPEALLAALRPDTRLLFACTPNNPTGGMMDEAAIARIAEATPPHVLLALDEAYYEFAQAAGGPDGLKVLAQHRRGPWIVLRTLSKAYALAGLRVGYAICSDEHIAGALNKVRQSFHVNTLAQTAALAALQDVDYGRELVARVIAERERLREGLTALGADCLPSCANFIAARLDRPAAPVVQALKEVGIMIGNVRTPTPGFENVIRVTVGLPEDTDALLDELRRLLAA